jgi:enamine deaminase RidA (YjgF/YER057c/UK114 family)
MNRRSDELMRDTVSTLQGANLSMAVFLNQPAQWQDSVLGARCFSADAVECRMQGDSDIPCMHVPMQRLDAGDSTCEVWYGSGPLTQGRCGDIHYRHDDGVLFGVIVLSETLFAAVVDKTPLQQATESAYRQMFALLDTLHYPYLFRCWNYLADINTHSFGLERYRQFNQGRQDAFLAHGREVVGNVPAASALGFGPRDSAQEPLTIAFLAGREASLNIENPRQVSAYQYPPQYGPRTPTFSRASLVRMGQDEVLFVSGTASIVGHATMHSENVVAQTHETMTNIETVLVEANRLAGQPRFDLRDLYYMVYVRDPADLTQIRAELAERVGDTLSAVYLQADVCRADLLLEIEATAAHMVQSMSGQSG